ncbi:cytochrome c oxidase assembly protein [Wenxinia marina]|uniref:Putative membrane protein n=1 Tax=Wenxinia marina DSM 24838 TaxID=1123501 RepID=A0A0D0Q6R4_9RHOB|nr:cytochrome c oxidase assembly protein [Wenxinia marina]KIQ68127.1 putative membrane protein [Wenxinia marina DSM 24838]GGL78480.1 hypothetical protein GCM10011392_36200 [Wenxinia marina]
MDGWIIDGTYCGPAPVPADLLLSWNLDPVLLAALAGAAFALRRTRAVWGVAVLFVAFVSPLCALSSALFAARTVHHVLLVAVAAPLLAAGWPTRRAPGVALPFLVSTATLWAWHLPEAYDLALGDMAVYWAMQLSLLGTATLFWRAVLASRAAPDALLWSLAGLMQMGFLGALLTFAPSPLYAAHAAAPLDWGLTPLADQQLGGLIMWVPAALPYLAMIALAARRSWRAAVAA